VVSSVSSDDSFDSAEPTTEELRVQQSRRERDERRREAVAETASDARAARRRAEKAGYLKEKLEEQAASEEP
jgi:hypothetical protein